MSENKKINIEKVFDLIRAIPDISELTMTPAIFDNDYFARDCDNCSFSKNNSGDVYDEGVCISCWFDAIKKS